MPQNTVSWSPDAQPGPIMGCDEWGPWSMADSLLGEKWLIIFLGEVAGMENLDGIYF